jgi:PIN domain nuclease of toxin-antitoxin system
MKYLLDTHTFIWWDSNAAHLSATVRALCQDPANILILSVASVWEMQIKLQLGKLKITQPLRTIIANQQASNRFEILNIQLEHVWVLDSLPLFHKDPFDRVLISQSISENIPILSHDGRLTDYPVQVIWS